MFLKQSACQAARRSQMRFSCQKQGHVEANGRRRISFLQISVPVAEQTQTFAPRSSGHFSKRRNKAWGDIPNFAAARRIPPLVRASVSRINRYSCASMGERSRPIDNGSGVAGGGGDSTG